MAFKVTVQEVNIEEVRNGRNKYDKAEVHYLFQGQPRSQKLVSFTNPSVFNFVRKLQPGQVIDVTTVKNGSGYSEWAKVELASADTQTDETPTATAPTRTKVAGSNYETPEERKLRQMYIIKQSSISNAIEYLSATKRTPEEVFPIDEVLTVAQRFVDFVYDNKPESLETMDSDI